MPVIFLEKTRNNQKVDDAELTFFTTDIPTLSKKLEKFMLDFF